MPRLRIMGKATAFLTVFSSFWAQSCCQEVSVREVEGIKSFASTGGLTFFYFLLVISSEQRLKGVAEQSKQTKKPTWPPSWGKSSLLPSSWLRGVQSYYSLKWNCFSAVHFRRVNWFLPVLWGVTWFIPHFMRAVWFKETHRALQLRNVQPYPSFWDVNLFGSVESPCFRWLSPWSTGAGCLPIFRPSTY